MMMIIFLVIQKIIMHKLELKKKEITLYPTQGEYFKYYIDEALYLTQLLPNISQLSCDMSSQVPDVELINSFQKIYQTEGHNFISVSSNNTHFTTLSSTNQVILYEWKNQILQQVGQPMTIDSSFICLSINLFIDSQILVDCYSNDQFFLMKLIDAQFNVVYNSSSYMPDSTEIQSIVNGSNTSIIYIQYFENNSIVSLFSDKFKNLSSFNNTFIDYAISNRINPYIYAINSQEIFQFSISQNNTFVVQFTYPLQQCSNYTIVYAYYNSKAFSQCDQVQVFCLESNNGPFVDLYWGCDNSIIGQANRNIDFSFQKILQNTQFVIYSNQINDTIRISQYQEVQSYQIIKISSNSQLFLNDNSELFSFNKEIIVYKIQLPALVVNLTNQEIVKNDENFKLTCYNTSDYEELFQLNITIQVLSQNDPNIYVMFNQNFPQNYIIDTSQNTRINFAGFSGQLLNYSLNSDNIPLILSQTTFEKVGELIKKYYLVQFVTYYYYQGGFFLTGYNNQTIDFYFCQIDFFQSQTDSCIQQNSIEIAVNATSLQIAYSIQPVIIISGLSDNNTIYLFKKYQSNSSISQLNHTFESQFSDFVVLYNNIIILILNEEVQIMSLYFTNTFILNQQEINKIFENIQFNPIQIVVNTQIFSNFLYINNVNNVIIVSIDQNNHPIPITLIPVNFTIKQINLVNQQLILSYICDQGYNICFQVWNIENLPKYFYVKSLHSVRFENNIIIQSDNLFIYVTFKNQTVYVYNPFLSQHMSLYYMIVLPSPIMCTLAYRYPSSSLYDSSIIFYENSYYELGSFQSYQLSYDLDKLSSFYFKAYPQVIYNYSVTSALDQAAFQSTQNQRVTFFINFTIFNNTQFEQVHLTQENLINTITNQQDQINSLMISFPMSLIIDRQVDRCSCQSPKYCYVEDQGFEKNHNALNLSLITSINNQFFALQNNSYIQIINADFIILSNLSYTQLYLSECLTSTSYLYKLYSICQNNSAQYWLTFNLNSSGYVTQPGLIQLSQTFSKIQKIRSLLNQYFILGIINNQFSYLYWINQTNNILQQISNYTVYSSLCLDFSIGELQFPTSHISSKIIMISSIIGYEFRQNGFSYVFFYPFYQLMLIDDVSITLTPLIFIQIQYCDQQFGCQYSQYSFKNILILEISRHDVTLLVGNTGISCVINLKIKDLKLLNTTSIATVIQTIPNYGNFQNQGNSFYYNGHLMQQFQNNHGEYIVGFYNLLDFTQGQIFEPILMYNSFTSSSNQYAMIINNTNSYRNGICLSIDQQSVIKPYQISTWNVSTIILSSKQDINVSIFCWNQFSQGYYNITFHLPPYYTLHYKRWIYALLSIIVILLLLFCIKVKQQTRNYLNINSEIQL